MTFPKTPLYHIRQPLISDNPPPSPPSLKASAKRRAWHLSVAVACLLATGTGVTVLASSPEAPQSMSSTTALVLPTQAEISQAELTLRANHLALNHQFQTEEERRQMLTDRIVSKYQVSEKTAREIVDAAHVVGPRYEIDPIMLLAITDVESNFNARAVSSAGAIGLTQIMPRVHAKKINRMTQTGKSVLDPEISLELGAQIFSEYRDLQRGNEIRALQQYNGSLKDGQQRYSAKVMRVYRTLGEGLPVAPDWPKKANLWVATSKGSSKG